MFRLARLVILMLVAFSAGTFAKDKTIQLGKDAIGWGWRWYTSTPTDGFKPLAIDLLGHLADAKGWKADDGACDEFSKGPLTFRILKSDGTPPLSVVAWGERIEDKFTDKELVYLR